MLLSDIIAKYDKLIWTVIHKFNVPQFLWEDIYSECKLHLINMSNRMTLEEVNYKCFNEFQHIVSKQMTITHSQIHYGSYNSHKLNGTIPISNIDDIAVYLTAPSKEYNLYDDYWDIIKNGYTNSEIELINLCYTTSPDSKAKRLFTPKKTKKELRRIKTLYKEMTGRNNNISNGKIIERVKYHIIIKTIKLLNNTTAFEILTEYNAQNVYNPILTIIKRMK